MMQTVFKPASTMERWRVQWATVWALWRFMQKHRKHNIKVTWTWTWTWK